MSRDSSGNCTRNKTGGYIAGASILAADVNAEIADIITMLTDSVSRSGKGALQANLDVGGYKIVNSDAGSASGNLVEYDQMNTAITASKKYKTGSFTRAMNSASGSQAVTGVGFQPKFLRFVCGVTGQAIGSWGTYDAATSQCMFESDDGLKHVTASLCVVLQYAATSAQQVASVASLDADGFTLTWTKNNSPTGTGFINWEAIG